MRKQHLRFTAFALIIFTSLLAGGCSFKKDPLNNAEVSLTYYTQNSLGNHFKEYIQKQTGINVEFLSTRAYGNGTMDILLSSGTMPDIIEYEWHNYKYSPQKLINYGYILELNELIDKYSPNYKAFLNEYPELAEQLCTTSGSFFTYPQLRLDTVLTQGLRGLMIRKDWLDDLGLSVPVTLDDFEQVLTAFKNEKGASCPYVDYTNFYNIISAYGIMDTFYLDGDTVCFGPTAPEYKEALKLLNRWYSSGLINQPNTVTSEIARQSIINGESGLAYGYAGSFLGSVNHQLKKENLNFHLIGIANPVQKEGLKPSFCFSDTVASNCAAISGTCKHPELAARFLDFGYSKEGQLLYNFGLENYTFKMIDGYPTYTDVIVNDNIAKSTNMSEYARTATGPFIQRKEYLEQFYASSEQTEASAVWHNDGTKTALPNLKLTDEEHENIYLLRQNIDEYVSTMSMRFILGLEDFENFDAFTSSLKQKQVGYLTNLYQKAYNRTFHK